MLVQEPKAKENLKGKTIDVIPARFVDYLDNRADSTRADKNTVES